MVKIRSNRNLESENVLSPMGGDAFFRLLLLFFFIVLKYANRSLLFLFFSVSIILIADEYTTLSMCTRHSLIGSLCALILLF